MVLTESAINLSDPRITPQRVTLKGVSWPTYLRLLQELGDHRTSRFSYDNGILEITMPAKSYEIINRLLARILVTTPDVDATHTTRASQQHQLSLWLLAEL